MCVFVGVHACVRDVFAIYDNNSIRPRLIMITIKIIILHFIQITHTDDFPSTGTRLVFIIHSACRPYVPVQTGADISWYHGIIGRREEDVGEKA